MQARTALMVRVPDALPTTTSKLRAFRLEFWCKMQNIVLHKFESSVLLSFSSETLLYKQDA
jgi:hypothetical protein